jgi:hypothetical protein
MSDALHTTELSPLAIHAALECAAASKRLATLTGPAGWRAHGILASPDATGRLPFLNPRSPLSALPIGTAVRVDLQGNAGNVSFYTQTRGTDGQGRWLLEVPTVIQVSERRADTRLDVFPGALSLEHPAHGTFEVVDLSPRGLSFRAPFGLVDQLGENTRFVLQVPVGDPIPVDLGVRNMRRAPGQPLMRIVGTRFAGNGNAVIAWYTDQTPELGVYAA